MTQPKLTKVKCVWTCRCCGNTWKDEIKVEAAKIEQAVGINIKLQTESCLCCANTPDSKMKRYMG